MSLFFRRAIAYYLDCTIVFTVVMLIIQYLILLPLRPSLGWTDEWLHNSWNMQLFVWSTISLPVWLYFSILDSSLSKATFGKRIFRLKVVDNHQQPLSFSKSFLRTLFKLLPWELAHMGVIFPTPLYFQDNPQIQIVTYIGLILLFIYVVSAVLYKNKSIYDFITSSQIISNP